MWLFQSNLALRGKLSGLAQVSPNSKYSNMWWGCCKSMLCPDKSYHVPGDEQRNVFWPELAKLPPQLYSLNYSLGKWNSFWIMQTDSQSTGIWCLRICARLPPAFQWSLHKKNHWIVDQVLSETLVLQNFKNQTVKFYSVRLACKLLSLHSRGIWAL